MGQLNRFFRQTERGLAHWCNGCQETHLLPLPNRGWSFNGDLEKPTLTPSFRHTGKQTVKVDGRWTGEWVLDSNGKPLDECCHYILTDGILNYCGDCTHVLNGQSVPLPELPDFLKDQ